MAKLNARWVSTRCCSLSRRKELRKKNCWANPLQRPAGLHTKLSRGRLAKITEAGAHCWMKVCGANGSYHGIAQPIKRSLREKTHRRESTVAKHSSATGADRNGDAGAATNVESSAQLTRNKVGVLLRFENSEAAFKGFRNGWRNGESSVMLHFHGALCLKLKHR
jgi:hypothetical protein